MYKDTKTSSSIAIYCELCYFYGLNLSIALGLKFVHNCMVELRVLKPNNIKQISSDNFGLADTIIRKLFMVGKFMTYVSRLGLKNK